MVCKTGKFEDLMFGSWLEEERKDPPRGPPKEDPPKERGSDLRSYLSNPEALKKALVDYLDRRKTPVKNQNQSQNRGRERSRSPDQNARDCDMGCNKDRRSYSPRRQNNYRGNFKRYNSNRNDGRRGNGNHGGNNYNKNNDK
jgi:hypothetical protein